MPRFVARLRGGPFDGDSGALNGWDTPPERIYAWACEDPRCPEGGIHWAADPEDAQFGAEIYEHEDSTAEGVHVYVWRDIAADLGNFLREVVEEPVPA